MRSNDPFIDKRYIQERHFSRIAYIRNGLVDAEENNPLDFGFLRARKESSILSLSVLINQSLDKKQIRNGLVDQLEDRYLGIRRSRDPGVGSACRPEW